jgi:flagellar basal-body rod protein FlgF
MDNTSYVALSSAMMKRRTLDLVANNMANANTAGYKGERGVFEEYVDKASGGTRSAPTSFVVDRGSYLETAQGGLSQSGNALDVALQGEGWLSYLTEAGERTYGRDGRMTIDAQGNLVTMNGHNVLDAGGGAIAIPAEAGDITIAKDGTISGTDGNVIAQIGMFDIPDIQAYARRGAGMFVPPEGAQPAGPALNSTLHQGFVEQSNVDSITEMTRMMEVQRSYDRASKLLENTAELKKQTISRLGRPA